MTVNIINFSSHELSSYSMARLKKEFGEIKVIRVPMQIDFKGDVKTEVAKIIDGLQPVLNTGAIPIVVLPAISYIATIVIAMIHGYAGNYPRVITIIRDISKNAYVIKDIIDLEGLRDSGRKMRNEFIKNSPDNQY